MSGVQPDPQGKDLTSARLSSFQIAAANAAPQLTASLLGGPTNVTHSPSSLIELSNSLAGLAGLRKARCVTGLFEKTQRTNSMDGTGAGRGTQGFLTFVTHFLVLAKPDSLSPVVRRLRQCLLHEPHLHFFSSPWRSRVGLEVLTFCQSSWVLWQPAFNLKLLLGPSDPPFTK